MYIPTLVKITSRAWALPILALMHNGAPARQAPLLAASGASRSAFAQSLGHLIEIGMLERNPGHGHPLRPEFRLTQGGIIYGAIAHDILSVTGSQHQPLVRRSWTVPVLSSLGSPRHFNDIKRGLPGITDRALSQSLKSMESSNWVLRSVEDTARPPRSLYRAINAGSQISQTINMRAF